MYFSGRPLLTISMWKADACLDDKAEACQVNVHLSAAQTHANSVADNFWAD
jgi:hypothetical protein